MQTYYKLYKINKNIRPKLKHLTLIELNGLQHSHILLINAYYSIFKYKIPKNNLN